MKLIFVRQVDFSLQAVAQKKYTTRGFLCTFFYSSSFPSFHPSPTPLIHCTPTNSKPFFAANSSALKLLRSTNSSPPTSALSKLSPAFSSNSRNRYLRARIHPSCLWGLVHSAGPYNATQIKHYRPQLDFFLPWVLCQTFHSLRPSSLPSF